MYIRYYNIFGTGYGSQPSATALPNGYVKAKTSVNTSDAVYNAWYDAVYEPQQTAVEPEPDPAGDETASG